MTTIQPWPADFVHRKWVLEALFEYNRSRKKDFFVAVTPAGGKTILYLAVGHDQLSTGRAKRLVIVVPTQALKEQVAREAARFGIHLDHRFENGSGRESSEFHGVVLTYAQVAANPDLHRANCRVPTLVVFDEPHHMGDDKAWGGCCRTAFEPAVARLLTTGTPFRSDNVAIPFVPYVQEGSGFRARPDFSYSYGEALRDGIVRPIYFPSYEGRMSWWDGERGDREASFGDVIPESEQSRRYLTAMTTGEWLPSVLREANNDLTETRNQTYGRAGGLVRAIDQTHAKFVADLVRRITGEAPALAISDEPGAAKVIADFRNSDKRWLVAVDMVTEGVDIPRLFTGVYASNVITEMAIRQFAGRFARKMPGIEDQASRLHFAKDLRIVPILLGMREERDHVLSTIGSEDESDDEGIGSRKGRDKQWSFFIPGSSKPAEPDSVFVEGDEISQVEIAEAKRIGERGGFLGVPPVLIAQIARQIRQLDGAAPAPMQPLPTPETVTLSEHKKTVKDLVLSIARSFAYRIGIEIPDSYRLLYYALGSYPKDATLDQLQRGQVLLQRWMKMAKQLDEPKSYEWWVEVARDARESAA